MVDQEMPLAVESDECHVEAVQIVTIVPAGAWIIVQHMGSSACCTARLDASLAGVDRSAST